MLERDRAALAATMHRQAPAKTAGAVGRSFPPHDEVGDEDDEDDEEEEVEKMARQTPTVTARAAAPCLAL
jgi:hypothetical protein